MRTAPTPSLCGVGTHLGGSLNLWQGYPQEGGPWAASPEDREHDDADGAEGDDEREGDPAEDGIGDYDGLAEQIGLALCGRAYA